MSHENITLSDKFRVIHLIDNSFKSDARVEKELNSLINFGIKILVCAIEDENSPKIEVRNGYNILRIFPKFLVASYYKFGYKLKMNKIISEIPMKETLIVHCHDFMMLRIGILIKKKFPDVYLIYDSHEYLKGWPYYRNADGWVNRMKGFFTWSYYVFIEKKDVKKADKIITINKEIASRLTSNFNLKEKPLVVGNYISKKSSSISNKYNLRSKLNLEKDDRIIIHSGTIYLNNKELDRILIQLRLLSQLKIHLVFMGNTDNFYRLKTNFQNKDKIHFIDFPIDIIERLSLISSANIGLLFIDTSMEAHRIGFSNRFIEYITAGIPVIANKQEFVLNFNSVCRCCKILEDSNMKNLNSLIKEILNNEEDFRNNIQNQREKIFWEDHEEVFMNYYMSILH